MPTLKQMTERLYKNTGHQDRIYYFDDGEIDDAIESCAQFLQIPESDRYYAGKMFDFARKIREAPHATGVAFLAREVRDRVRFICEVFTPFDEEGHVSPDTVTAATKAHAELNAALATASVMSTCRFYPTPLHPTYADFSAIERTWVAQDDLAVFVVVPFRTDDPATRDGILPRP